MEAAALVARDKVRSLTRAYFAPNSTNGTMWANESGCDSVSVETRLRLGWSTVTTMYRTYEDARTRMTPLPTHLSFPGPIPPNCTIVFAGMVTVCESVRPSSQ